MSTSYSVYIGPYVIAPEVIVLEPPRNVRTECTASKAHVVPQHANFCPHCGAATTMQTTMLRVKRPLDLYDVADNVDSVIWRPESFDGVWLSNNTSRAGGIYCNTNDDGHIMDVPTEEDIAHEIDMMTTATNFIDELIETKYGVTLEIKYGIISFWN